MLAPSVHRLLILGGTADARQIAQALCSDAGAGSSGHNNHCLAITYSVAGLVRKPQLPCKVISGGFSQFGGLGAYIGNHRIDAVLDITHPYALQISQLANEAAALCDIPCWRFHRHAWQPIGSDDWHECEDWQTVLEHLEDKSSIFLTAGQLPLHALATLQSLYGGSDKNWVLRTAVEPSQSLSAGMHWMKAIGPFSEDDEMALMQKYDIDALVSKNSGGDSTSAKLNVARKLGIPVYMLTRPSAMPADQMFTDLPQCEHYVREYFNNALVPLPNGSARGPCRP